MLVVRRSALAVARSGRFYSQTAAQAEAGHEFLAQRAAVKEHAKGVYPVRYSVISIRLTR